METMAPSKFDKNSMSGGRVVVDELSSVNKGKGVLMLGTRALAGPSSMVDRIHGM